MKNMVSMRIVAFDGPEESTRSLQLWELFIDFCAEADVDPLEITTVEVTFGSVET
jgi:hypothetical protein